MPDKVSDSDDILAYRAGSPVEAHALVGRLADAGIDARVLGESLQGAYAGIQLGGMDLPEVWIAGKDRKLAAPIIAAWKAEHFPVTSPSPSRRFQFPLSLLLIAMTFVAFQFGWGAMSETARGVFAPLVNLILFTAFMVVAWMKIKAKRLGSDDD